MTTALVPFSDMQQMACKHCERMVYCKGLCRRHYSKLQRYGDPLRGYTHERSKGTGTVTADGYIERKIDGVSRLEHLLIVERVLGKPLPPKARVHHADGNPANNATTNLVVCPNDKYHQLLHMRMRALAATGNANYLKCMYCKQWDAPERIKLGKRVKFHQGCKNAYEARRAA